MSALQAIVYGVYGIIAAFALVAFRHWRRTGIPLARGLGLQLDRRLPSDLAVGVVIGATAIATTNLAQWLAGTTTVTGFRAPTGRWWLLVAGWIGGFALIEEVLFRALLLNGLRASTKDPRWAVAVSAVLFGLWHVANPHASAPGIVSNALGGVVYAIAYMGTGRLALGWAIHFGWNFVQGPLLSLPISGYVSQGFIDQDVSGPVWFTGGAYGPEASLPGFAARLGELAMVAIWLRRRRKENTGFASRPPSSSAVLGTSR